MANSFQAKHGYANMVSEERPRRLPHLCRYGGKARTLTVRPEGTAAPKANYRLMPLRGLLAPSLAFLGLGAFPQQPKEPITIEHRGPINVELRKTYAAGPLVAGMFPAYIRERENVVRVISDNPFVTWGTDSLAADTITVDEETGFVTAKGRAVLTDPIGTLRSTEIVYNYNTGRGWARLARVNAQGAYFQAATVELNGGVWYAYHGTATTCDLAHSHYDLKFDKLALRPGSKAKVYKPVVDLFGHGIFRVPSFQFSLRKRREPIAIPSFGYSKRQGFSLAWHNRFEVSRRLDLVTGVGAFERAVPERRELLSYSLLAPNGHGPVLTLPDTEEGERFSDSHIDNVNVPSPEMEDERLRAQRAVVFFENSSNLPVSSRIVPDLFLTKDYEVGVQANASVGRAFGAVTVRTGRVIENPGARLVDREALQGIGSLGTLWVRPGLGFRFRADAAYFRYDQDQKYGWVRTVSEIVLEPSDRLRLSAAFVRTLTGGTPVLFFDEPIHSRVFQSRMDVGIKGLHLSLLTKYDVDLQDLYDIEIALAVRAHCVEPVFAWRKDTGEFRLGIRLPAVDLLKTLARERGGR